MADGVGGFLLGLLPNALKAVGSIDIPGVSAAANMLAGALDKDKLTPEQQAQLNAALLPHEEKMAELALQGRQLDAGVAHDDVDLAKAELASGDKFTSRARPSLLYLAGGITAIIALTDMALAVYAAINHTEPVVIPSGATIELLLPLWGHAGFYTFSRTQEKKASIDASVVGSIGPAAAALRKAA